MALMLATCSKTGSDRRPQIQTDFNSGQIQTDFNLGKDGWQAGFSEYNADYVESYELEEGLAPLPAPLDNARRGYRLSGMNRSDDLFMYLVKRVQHLRPETTYRGHFVIEIASAAPTGGVGAGGPPGEAVGLGIGMTVIQPLSAPDEHNYYRMNIDKINQSTDGTDMILIGDIANGSQDGTYRLIERSGSFTARTDQTGELWLIVGTDSGFEGKTTIYYTRIKVLLEEI